METDKNPCIFGYTFFASGCAYFMSYLDILPPVRIGGKRQCAICSQEISREEFKEKTDGIKPSHITNIGRAWDFGGMKQSVTKYKKKKYDITYVDL